MQLEQVIPHVTKDGNEYLIQFGAFEADFLPDDFKIPIIDLSLILVTKVKSNDREILGVLSKYLLEYLDKFDVIIYYYSDIKDIPIRKSRNISPQEFRHKLFSCLFKKYGNDSLILQPTVITDTKAGDHYISLISNIKNKDKIDKAKEVLREFHK